jgi:hypothetical protein
MILGILCVVGATASPALTWAPDGQSVLVEGPTETLACGRQRLEVASMTLASEPPGQVAPGDGGRLTLGEGVATWRGGGKVVTTPLPALVPPGPEYPERWFPSLGAWLDPRTYLWCQHDDYEGLGSGCALLHPAEGRVEFLPAGSLDPYAAWDLRPGPGGWLAVFRSLEGHLDVEVLRREGTGFAPSGPPMPSLYDCGPLEVHYPGDGAAVWLVTPCALAERPEGHPCLGLEGVPVFEMGTPWRWYTWRPGQQALKLARADLPAGAAPSPDGATLAWATDDLVCLGDPAHPEAARCTYLPEKLPAGEVCPGEGGG